MRIISIKQADKIIKKKGSIKAFPWMAPDKDGQDFLMELNELKKALGKTDKP